MDRGGPEKGGGDEKHVGCHPELGREVSTQHQLQVVIKVMKDIPGYFKAVQVG